ncbi:MAG: thioredoxin family protein [Candidatus Krumholzibacteriia bacterium]|nr:thioredoxin family protein [bacterium]MCB9514521.1 thioredoxin family protein [Candidatus Latescibacterota bacterium]MCB9515431.1 thioredoxin family protein [Candidatus Latescibacterota bacterium]
MRTVQILGTGCPKCRQLEANAREAAAAAGDGWQVEKVSDLKAIMAFGVMMTPALAVDGVVKSTGKVLSPDAIRELLT